MITKKVKETFLFDTGKNFIEFFEFVNGMETVDEDGEAVRMSMEIDNSLVYVNAVFSVSDCLFLQIETMTEDQIKGIGDFPPDALRIEILQNAMQDFAHAIDIDAKVFGIHTILFNGFRDFILQTSLIHSLN